MICGRRMFSSWDGPDQNLTLSNTSGGVGLRGAAGQARRYEHSIKDSSAMDVERLKPRRD